MITSIDIGTSYSSICILGPDGRAQPVDIGTGTSMFGSKYSLPSAVFVEDSGNVLVGQAAMNSRRLRPQNFRMEFKRNLGEDAPILLGNRSFRPEDLYTELFRHMKECAEKVGGSQVEKTYLSYPASYGKQRKEKLCSAASAAGLFEVELVDEPTAAAMCYCAEGYIKDGQTLLVYDFGGGTFDVSLIRYQDGAFQLLSEPMGLERCGGMDIDYLIAQDMKAAIDREAPGAWAELEKNPNRFMRFTSQINELAVKAKHHLSAADMFEEYIEAGMDDIHYQLTAGRLNEMIAPLVGQTIQLCRRALEEAGISPSELSAVLMVGGTSRIPLVQEMAGKITGKPALCATDLELAVAQGALMYNEYQNQKDETWQETAQEYLKVADLDDAGAMNNLGECYENGLGVAQDYKQAFGWYQKAADLGNADAMYNLGECYANGRGVTQDYCRADRWYQKAADLGNADAMYNLGRYREAAKLGNANAMYKVGVSYLENYNYNQSNWGHALKWFRKAAELGNSDAIKAVDYGVAGVMNHLGVCYENGLGVAQDYDKAVEWYRKAADCHNNEAMNNLGSCYKNGQGVVQDYGQAVKWYRRSADLDNADAMYNLGVCYANGQGVVQDYGQAVEWYRRSADLDNADAMYNLGVCYANGQGVVQDYGQAVEWYRRSADLDNADAMYNLGVCYANGQGVAQDSGQEVQWYRKAADLGHAFAMNNLGWCYENGLGVAQDSNQAAQWYRKAADLGDVDAMFNLGDCYYFDQKDYDQAVKWYRKAADLGDANAMSHLGVCYLNGHGVTQDYVQAVEWYRKAADLESAGAMNNLGVCYENGLGVTQDYVQAIQWYRKAADLESADAMNNLGVCYENGLGVAQDYVQAVQWYCKASELGNAYAEKHLRELIKR